MMVLSISLISNALLNQNDNPIVAIRCVFLQKLLTAGP